MIHLSPPFSALLFTIGEFFFFSLSLQGLYIGFKHFHFNLGLTKKVLHSKISEKEAEKQVSLSS